MIRRLLKLAGATIAFWTVTAIPASYWGRPNALATSAVAATLCFMPTAVVIVWARWARHKSGDQNVLMLVGGMGLRMTTVLLGAWLLTGVKGISDFQNMGPWLVVFYLFCLALEIAVVIGEQNISAIKIEGGHGIESGV